MATPLGFGCGPQCKEPHLVEWRFSPINVRQASDIERGIAGFARLPNGGD